MAKISEVGRSKTQDTPPDHGTNTEYDPLLEGQAVEYIKHVGRYVSSSRNAAYEARGSADNPLKAAQRHSRGPNLEGGGDNRIKEAQMHSRETNLECGAVIKPRCDKGMDKSSSSSGGERARDDKQLTQVVVELTQLVVDIHHQELHLNC